MSLKSLLDFSHSNATFTIIKDVQAFQTEIEKIIEKLEPQIQEYLKGLDIPGKVSKLSDPKDVLKFAESIDTLEKGFLEKLADLIDADYPDTEIQLKVLYYMESYRCARSAADYYVQENLKQRVERLLNQQKGKKIIVPPSIIT